MEACRSFEENLAAYLEGESRPEVLAHANECDFCRCILADVGLIRSVSPEFGLEDPPAAVWTNIRATLVEEGIIHVREGFWRRWLPGKEWHILRHPAPVAAAVAVLAAVILFKAPGYLVHPGPGPEAANVIHAAVFTQDVMASQDISNLRQTIGQLEQVYRANQSLLEPSMKSTYDKSLTSLDDEIRECQASMQAQPENDLARQYLSTAYVQKAQLLQSALEYNLR